jgi:hypothetical protein
MTALTKHAPLPAITEGIDDLPMAAVTIYDGAAVGQNSSGYARGFTLGDRFRGHAISGANNSAGSAGDKLVHVRRGRYLLEVSLTGVAITSAGAPVFIADDGSYSLRAGLMVGRVARYVSSGKAVVLFDTDSDLCCLSETVAKSGFTDGGSTSGYVDLATQIPAGSLILGCEYNVVGAASGDTSAVIQVGKSGSTAIFTADTAQSVFAAGLKGSAAPVATQYVGAAVTPRVTITSGSDFGLISADMSIDVRIWYRRLS